MWTPDLVISKEKYLEIYNSYINTITIPPRKESRQIFICPVGFMGSGKSTVLRGLASYISYIKVSSDDIRKLLREQGYGEQGSNIPGRIYDDALNYFIATGHSIAFDSNCSRSKERIEAKAKQAHADVVWILVNPPESFIINKLKSYNHTWLFRDGEHAVERYHTNKQKVQIDGLPFFCSIDTSLPDIKDQIANCAANIRSAFIA